MKNKIFLLSLIITILISGYFYVNPFSDSSAKNLENKVAALSLNANDLVNAFARNETKSNNLYEGKIIEITGSINEITFLNDRNTIILNSNNESFGVICDINPNQKEKINKLKKHQKIRIKGICKGFLKDVILLNCTIDLIPNE
jgi:ABC-type lipoprotein release transport system permease subunit